jgi:hypothetical protein
MKVDDCMTDASQLLPRYFPLQQHLSAVDETAACKKPATSRCVTSIRFLFFPVIFYTERKICVQSFPSTAENYLLLRGKFHYKERDLEMKQKAL